MKAFIDWQSTLLILSLFLPLWSPHPPPSHPTPPHLPATEDPLSSLFIWSHEISGIGINLTCDRCNDQEPRHGWWMCCCSHIGSEARTASVCLVLYLSSPGCTHAIYSNARALANITVRIDMLLVHRSTEGWLSAQIALYTHTDTRTELYTNAIQFSWSSGARFPPHGLTQISLTEHTMERAKRRTMNAAHLATCWKKRKSSMQESVKLDFLIEWFHIYSSCHGTCQSSNRAVTSALMCWFYCVIYQPVYLNVRWLAGVSSNGSTHEDLTKYSCITISKMTPVPSP